MAGNIINQTLDNGILSIIADLPGMSLVIQIFQAVGVVVLIYFIILIIKALFQMKQARSLKKIASNVEEINSKLDILTGKKATAKKEKNK